MRNYVIELPSKRYQYHIMREVQQIEELMPAGLPDGNVLKLISQGGFSSIGFIKFVADRCRIDRLIASTLRVGKKHAETLDVLHSQGRIKQATFIIGSVMKNDSESGKAYGYYDTLESMCEKNGWNIICRNNHSKVLLMDTAHGKFVVETSSNLNENPNMEQFSFEKNSELFDFYESALTECLGGDLIGD